MADRSVPEQLTRYLTDVHSIEVQALAQLKAAPGIAGDERLAEVFREHLEETREQSRLVEERLKAHDARPSRFQSTGLRIGGVNLGGFFAAQPDTP
jgi:ferritin-like metal-binding protein YciE